jgi:translation elongation factor EF-4
VGTDFAAMATILQAAAYIGTDEIEFLELIHMGVIQEHIDGEYDLQKVLIVYINYMRKVIAGLAADTPTAFNKRKREIEGE